jgi:hypothetical protein
VAVHVLTSSSGVDDDYHRTLDAMADALGVIETRVS